MAKGANKLPNLAFRMMDKELERKIQEYKQMTEAEDIVRPSWPHFCAFLGYTEKEVTAVIRRGEAAENAYTDRSIALKRMATWMRGQYCSNRGWGGQNQSKAIFALKQDVGDGVRYQDKDMGPQGPQEIRVTFGGSDPRARKACK